MDDIRTKAKEIAQLPLSESNLNPRIIRSLSRAGFATLLAAFDEDESEIKEILGSKLFNEFTGLVDSYSDSPEAFIEFMSKERSKRNGTAPLTPPKDTNKSESVPLPYVRKDFRATNGKTDYIHESCLDNPHGRYLKQNQERAQAIFDDFCDRYESVLIYQAFPEFSVDLKEIREAFLKLFNTHPSHPRKALQIAEQYLPDIFLIFVADLARDVYSDDNLWGNFVGVLPLNQNTLSDLKELFVRLLKRRNNMPLYAQDESAYYYLYTTLLHGGLSQESWDSLWSDSLLPLVDALNKGEEGYAGELRGHEIVRLIKDSDSRYSPKKESVGRILQKAPDSTIVSLFESALKAAIQIESKYKQGNDYIVLDSFDLPEVAESSLWNVLERKNRNARSTSSNAGSSSKKNAPKSFVPPAVNMYLDLNRGKVVIRWPQKQYSPDLFGHRVDIYIDGNKYQEQYFELSHNRCVLEEIEVDVHPQGRYDVEIRLMKPSEEAESGFTEAGSEPHVFEQNKPGCFEFILGLDGLYRLRTQNDRIKKPRQIAYVVKTGYFINPGPGMTRVSEHETDYTWANASILIYKVEPGASGAISKKTEEGSLEEVVAWHESYKATINNHRIIGETTDGLDLFGYMESENGSNGGLPWIEIESADGYALLDDLEIVGTCDGKPFSVPRVPFYDSDSNKVSIVLPLERAIQIDLFAERVEIEIRQKSLNNKVIFRYRFSVIPIDEFRLARAQVENGAVVAIYSFRARLNTKIYDLRGNSTDLPAWSTYSKKMLLKDEYLRMTFASEDDFQNVNAKLALAAINIELPEKLVELSKECPLCLADAIQMGQSKGEVVIKVLGWRYNRNIIASLCAGGTFTHVFFFRELTGPTTLSLNLFAHPSIFLPSGSKMRDCSLFFFIDYGDEYSDSGTLLARTGVEALRCKEGIGFSQVGVVSNGVDLIMKLDSSVLCDALVRFKRVGRRPRDLSEVSVSKGVVEIVIPDDAARELRAKKEVVAQFVPKRRMSKVEENYAFDVPLEG